MIAEKTADAIRGRKLKPFEPPTRIAAGQYNLMPTNTNRMPKDLYYKSSHQTQLNYPPPLAQNYPPTQHNQHQIYHRSQDLEETLNEVYINNNISSSLNTNFGQFSQKLVQQQQQHNPIRDYEEEDAAASDSDDHHNHNHHHNEFLLNRYSNSMMADTLMKRISPSVR